MSVYIGVDMRKRIYMCVDKRECMCVLEDLLAGVLIRCIS